MFDVPRFGLEPRDGSPVGALKFEAKSFLGRLFSPARRQPTAPLLQLGCGPRLFDGFENVDFYAMKFWRSHHVGHDLRQPLPYPSQSFEGAFSEHTLEHLAATDALAMLRDVHRVLKPGAVFRVIVPDLEQYVRFYDGGDADPRFETFSSGCEAIWSLTQNHGHLSCWDAEMLTKQLLAAGFASAARSSFNVGQDARLVRDSADRRWESLYVEAVA